MHDFLMTVMMAWGAVTAILICLLIYRGTLEAHEDDQVFWTQPATRWPPNSA